MVSSLYVMADCTGAYLGSALGGLVRMQKYVCVLCEDEQVIFFF